MYPSLVPQPGSQTDSQLRIEISEGDVPPAGKALRTRIFVEEQGVSERDEIDGHDPDCVHFLARDGARAVGCARLRPLGGARAKVERVAVDPDLRQGGLGRRIMEAMEAEAERRGWPELVLHAQVPVVEFYRRLGWNGVGEEFEEAGIAHLEMVKRVRPSRGLASP